MSKKKQNNSNEQKIGLNYQEIEYLAFQGGGGKGMANLGALIALEKAGVIEQLKGISGSSAGAITALMVYLGYSAKEVNELMVEQAHFVLAFAERTRSAKSRAYTNSIKDPNDHPICGFLSSKKHFSGKVAQFSKLSHLANNLSQRIVEDKFTLSNKIFKALDEIGVKDDMERPNELKKILEGVKGKLLNPLDEGNFLTKAFLNGIIKTLSADNLEILLENIADSLLEELEKDWQKIKKLLPIPFLHEAFNNWKKNKIKGLKNYSLTYAILIGVIILTALITPKKWKNLKLPKLSTGNKLKKQLNNVKKYLKLIGQIYWGARGSFLLNPLQELETYFDKIGILGLATGVDIIELDNFVKRAVGYFAKPITQILKEGGLLDGARVRFLLAFIIYNKVDVINIKGRSNGERFQKREKSLLSTHEYQDIIKLFKTTSLKDFNEMEAKEKIKKLEAQLKDSSSEVKKISQALKNKISEIRNQISLNNIKEKLKIIERYYDFEINHKLFEKEFVIGGANISTSEAVFFNKDITPNFSVVEAIGGSMNMPGIFRGIAVNYIPPKGKGKFANDEKAKKDFYSKSYRGWFYDSGMYNNFPILAFNHLKKDGKVKYNGFATPYEVMDKEYFFPENKILGVGRESYVLDKGPEKEKEKENPFLAKKLTIGKLLGGLYESLFDYPAKLRGHDRSPVIDHMVFVNTGFMDVIDFSVDPKELVRIEPDNLNLVLRFINATEEDDPAKVILEYLGKERRLKKIKPFTAKWWRRF